MRDEMHLSSLVTIWFQEERLRVPDDPALAALQLLDWEKLAVDYET
jgi:hypothetical protein